MVLDKQLSELKYTSIPITSHLSYMIMFKGTYVIYWSIVKIILFCFTKYELTNFMFSD